MARYEAYHLWARILGERHTPFGQQAVFNFDDNLKDDLRNICEGVVAGDPPRGGSIYVADRMFVKMMVTKYIIIYC